MKLRTKVRRLLQEHAVLKLILPSNPGYKKRMEKLAEDIIRLVDEDRKDKKG